MTSTVAALIYNGQRLTAGTSHSANYFYREAIRLELVRRGVSVFEVYTQEPIDQKMLYKYCHSGEVSFIISPNFQLTKLHTHIDGVNVFHELGTKVFCPSDSIACNIDKIYKRVPAIGDTTTYESLLDDGPRGHKVDAFFHGDAMDIPCARHIFPNPCKHFHLRSMCLPTNGAVGTPPSDESTQSRDKDIDVLFAFNLRGSFEYQIYEDLTSKAKALVDHLIAVLAVTETTQPVQDAIWDEMKKINVRPFDKYSYQHLVVARMVNRGVRDFRRKAVLKALRRFNVFIVTPKPENLGFEIPSNWTVKTGATWQELQALYPRVKIALNVLPAYGYGTTDRITTGMAMGAVSLTDRNMMLSNIFSHNQDILFYDYDDEHIENLAADVLSRPKQLEEIAVNGKKKALSEFSITRYVDDLLAAADGTLTQKHIPHAD